MTEVELFEFYQGHFKLIYSDLVAITGKKHLEIDGQIESAMSHLAVGHTCGDAVKKQSNIDEAYAHLGRACLDAAKLLWLDRRDRVERIMNDKFVRRWCTNVSEAVLLDMQNKAENLARKARKDDAMGAGHAAKDLVASYYEATHACQDIINSIDPTKVQSVSQFRWWYIAKQQLGGFLVGVLAAGLVAGLVWYLTPSPNPPVAPSNTKPEMSAPG